MDKGFTITCNNCGEEMKATNDGKEEWESNINIAMWENGRDRYTLNLVCSNCKNNVERE